MKSVFGGRSGAIWQRHVKLSARMLNAAYYMQASAARLQACLIRPVLDVAYIQACLDQGCKVQDV